MSKMRKLTYLKKEEPPSKPKYSLLTDSEQVP